MSLRAIIVITNPIALNIILLNYGERCICGDESHIVSLLPTPLSPEKNFAFVIHTLPSQQKRSIGALLCILLSCVSEKLRGI